MVNHFKDEVLIGKRIGLISDVHQPVHDSMAYNLVLDVFEDIGVDEIYINGDFLDAYTLNAHGPKHPDIQFTLEDEYRIGRESLEKLAERFPKITYGFGNHEYRLDRYITHNAPHFWNFVTTEKMLGLDRLNIVHRPYNSAYLVPNTDLRIQHSPPSYGQNAARTSLLKKFGGSWIWGCTHRMNQAHLTKPDGSVSSAYMNGWLGSVDETDQHKFVFSYTKNHENWQKGFMVIDVMQSDYFVHQCIIKNNRTTLDGHLYEATEQV